MGAGLWMIRIHVCILKLAGKVHVHVLQCVHAVEIFSLLPCLASFQCDSFP